MAAEAELEVAWCDQNLGVLLASAGQLKEAASRFGRCPRSLPRRRALDGGGLVFDANLAIVIDAIDGDGAH